MTTKLTIAITLLVTLTGAIWTRPTPGQAQNRPTVHVDMVTFDYAPTAATQGSDDPTEIMSVATTLGLVFPTTFANGRTELTHTLSWRHLDKGFRNWTYADDSDEYVVHSNTYAYRIQATHRVSDQWEISASVAPEMKSNLEYSLEGAHYFVSGSAMAMRTLSDRWSVGVGAAYSRVFGRSLPYPIIGVEWNHSDAPVSARLLLPEEAEIRWAPVRFLDVAARARVDGDVFVGGLAETYGMDDARVRFTNATFASAIELRLADWVSVSGEGGYAFFRQMRADNSAGQKANFDPAGGQFVRIGLRIGVY